MRTILFVAHCQRDGVIDSGRRDKKRKEAPVPPAVKDEAGADDQDVLFAPAQLPIERPDDCQKNEINRRGEAHERDAEFAMEMSILLDVDLVRLRGSVLWPATITSSSLTGMFLTTSRAFTKFRSMSKITALVATGLLELRTACTAHQKRRRQSSTAQLAIARGETAPAPSPFSSSLSSAGTIAGP